MKADAGESAAELRVARIQRQRYDRFVALDPDQLCHDFPAVPSGVSYR
jgi:hypothetical protein